jgi:hypothetical protein
MGKGSKHRRSSGFAASADDVNGKHIRAITLFRQQGNRMNAEAMNS